MIIELEPIFNIDGASFSFDYEMPLLGLEVSGVNPVKDPVRVFGSVKNNTGIVTLKATARFTYVAPCDRCCEPTARVFEFPIEHTLIASLNNEDNDDFLQVSDMRLNMDELATEDINLQLPSKFLCSEDCKGLCPQCGKNLNDGPCGCKKPIDPRLQGLLQFLDNE